MRIVRSQAARADLLDHYVYLAESAGAAIADRFLGGVESALATINDQPNIGAPVATDHPDLQGVRKWTVHGFDNFLIFYKQQRADLLVVRVLHRSRDWWGILGVSS